MGLLNDQALLKFNPEFETRAPTLDMVSTRLTLKANPSVQIGEYQRGSISLSKVIDKLLKSTHVSDEVHFATPLPIL